MIENVFILKFIKFSIVGLSGVFIDFLITWFTKERLKWNKYIANSLGFITAASSNYILNKFWTFQTYKNEMLFEYISFVSIALVGLAINNLIIYFLTNKYQINFYLSKIIAIIIVTIWNFLANYFYTFN